MPLSFQAIVEKLLERTGASRTTIRLDTPGDVFPVVAEALAPGVRSIRDDTAIDLRAAPTFQFLERGRRNLVQDDCSAGENPPPPELIELYGVKAQMLAPLVRDDRVVGIVSVHDAPSTRRWTDENVAALEDGSRRAVAELEAGGGS